ncbi:hypothetical protein [Holospora obtusa]|uniref:hypothetical protein n=1 Tax=Holospora obtusa TaxID=49893 RepID=UPI0003AEB6F1|nr:hypothetical protein [Holospora obtusa]
MVTLKTRHPRYLGGELGTKKQATFRQQEQNRLRKAKNLCQRPMKIKNEQKIAKLFNASISVYQRLKKLGFSYKKTLPTCKQAKKNESDIKKL